ncbi:MAG: hypothetical protein R2695_20165 [Acidimicrobiales bacterium]
MIERAAATRVALPGLALAPFRLWRLVARAVGWADAVYTFFASEHAVLPGLVARVRERRFVSVGGGYDVANHVPEHGYGLPSRWPHRLVPVRWCWG